jgi:putative ABC transport system permease protein
MSAARLALSNLLHDRKRSAVCVAGTAFAALLLFMQLGFLGAVTATATMLFDRLKFDILLTSSEYLDFTNPGSVARSRLATAAAVPGVAAARPLAVAPAAWRNPTADPARGRRRWPLTVLGVDPAGLPATFGPTAAGVFADPAEQAQAGRELARTGAVFLDRKARRDFGDPRAMPPGTRTAVNATPVELIDYFELGTGFSYAGLLLASEETFAAVTGVPPDRVAFGLVTLDPAADPAATLAALRRTLPRDVRAVPRAEALAGEVEFWVNQTAVGTLFRAGAALALVVGAVFVYQMITADIRKRLPEYATLTAVGYPFGFLARVVLWQATLIAGAGYLFGAAVAVGLYELTRQAAQLPMALTPGILLRVLALTVGMCGASGLLAVRVVRAADPADLF